MKDEEIPQMIGKKVAQERANYRYLVVTML